MDALHLHIYLALFSLGILLSALLIFLDIKRHRNQEQPGMVVRDHPWTTAAAFVFDLIQVCLSVAGVVGTSVALSSHPDRIEALWLDAVIICYLQLLVGNYSTHLLRLFQYSHWFLLCSYTMIMLSVLSTYLIVYIANTKAIVSTAKSVFLLTLAGVSCSSAEVIRRVLQNHRYAAGLSRPTGEEGDDRFKVMRFLATSTKISVFVSFIHISGAVFLSVSLLARWRMGTACSDSVFLICTAAQSLCYLPAGIAVTRRWVYVPVSRDLGRMWPRMLGNLNRTTDQDA